MHVTHIDHVGIAVADLPAALAFYEGVCGLRVTHSETNIEQGVREVMLATETGETQLQLLAPLRDDSPISRFLAHRGPGIQQIAYRVTDIESAAAEFRAAGCRLLFAEPKRGTSNSKVNFVHPKDTGGVLIELVEPATGDS